MEHTHPAALWLMVASAIAAAVCCLAAGRAVPWQGRVSAVAMSAGMLLLVLFGGDARVPLLVGAGWIVAAMIGTAGLRGHPSVRACCHRALGCVVMAASVLPSALPPAAAAAAGSVAGHSGHGGPVPLAALTGLGVLVLLVWQVVDHHRRARTRAASSRRTTALLDAEGAAMAVGVVVMWVVHL